MIQWWNEYNEWIVLASVGLAFFLNVYRRMD